MQHKMKFSANASDTAWALALLAITAGTVIGFAIHWLLGCIMIVLPVTVLAALTEHNETR
jgi:hypothetical protein